MDIRVEIVDPREFGAVASEVLIAAWRPPCLQYSPEYVTWQFSFPGNAPGRAALAFIGNQPVGCAAVTARQVLLHRVAVSANVLSFVAVHPTARGKGLSTALYAALLEAVPPGLPVISFTEPNSIGEQVLLKSFAEASFARQSLLSCRAVGYVSRPETRVFGGKRARQATSYADFISAASTSNVDETTIWNHPTPEQWAHYQADPRERLMIVAEDHGVPLGAAMAVMADFISPEGPQRVPMLESISLLNESAGALHAVFNFVAQAWETTSAIIASNVSFLDATSIKNSGARALPSIFNAHLFAKAGISLPNVSRLNLEVI